MSKIYMPTIVCPYLLVCGKCSLDKTGNKICHEENPSWVCGYGKKMIEKEYKNRAVKGR